MIVLKSIGAGREKKRKDILIHAHAVSFLAPRYFELPFLFSMVLSGAFWGSLSLITLSELGVTVTWATARFQSLAAFTE